MKLTTPEKEKQSDGECLLPPRSLAQDGPKKPPMIDEEVILCCVISHGRYEAHSRFVKDLQGWELKQRQDHLAKLKQRRGSFLGSLPWSPPPPRAHAPPSAPLEVLKCSPPPNPNPNPKMQGTGEQQADLRLVFELFDDNDSGLVDKGELELMLNVSSTLMLLIPSPGLHSTPGVQSRPIFVGPAPYTNLTPSSIDASRWGPASPRRKFPTL
jgi:hypothetical protein